MNENTNKQENTKGSAKKELANAKKEFHNEIITYKLMLTRMIANRIDLTIEKRIKELYTLCNYYIESINKIKNLEDLKSEVIKFKAKVNSILNSFITEYCQKYNIKTDRNKLERYWFDKLCEELDEALNKDNAIEAILNKKELEYQSHPDYDIIKKYIPEIKKHVMKMYYDNYHDKTLLAKHFDFRISVALRIHQERLEIINYYKSLCSTDNFIINQIELMEKNIDGSTITFKKLEIELKKYIEKIKENEKRQKRFIKILKKKK